MNKKLKFALGRFGIPVIIAVLSVLGYSQFTGIQDVGFIYSVTYSGDEVALIMLLSVFKDGDAVKVIFESNALLHSADAISLQSDTDYTGISGDKIILLKSDGIWSEIGRTVLLGE